jgi:hypothetical protein
MVRVVYYPRNLLSQGVWISISGKDSRAAIVDPFRDPPDLRCHDDEANCMRFLYHNPLSLDVLTRA